MPSPISLITAITAFLLTWSIAIALGGALALVRWRGRLRWLGLPMVLFGVGAAGLQALMSSKYWPVETTRIDANIMQTLAAFIPLSLVIGSAVVGSVFIARRLDADRRDQKLVPGLMRASGIALGTITLGLAGMVSLSRAQDRVVPPADVRKIEVAPGFTISLYANDKLRSPTGIAVGPDNRLYVSDLTGKIWAITSDESGLHAGSIVTYATGFDWPVGVTWRGNDLYVPSNGKVTIVQDTNGDHVADKMTDIINDLPTRIHTWHQNNAITCGPDGRMYFDVGSTSDHDEEKYPLGAAIISANADGSDVRVFARGLRNTFKIAINAAGDMFGGDNGPGGLPVTPNEEVNFLVKDGDYGFPREFGIPTVGSKSKSPVVLFPPHTSPDGMTFYNGQQFPTAYRDNLFVGLWNYGDLYRVELTKDAGEYRSRVTHFASGFVNPLDMTVGPDGALYVLDFATNAVYRIAWAG